MARDAATVDHFATHRSPGHASARVDAQPGGHPSPRPGHTAAVTRPGRPVPRTNLLGEVHAAYLDGRGRAMSTTTVRLRWQYRRLAGRSHRLDQIALSRLLAVHDELRARGCLPS